MHTSNLSTLLVIAALATCGSLTAHASDSLDSLFRADVRTVRKVRDIEPAVRTALLRLFEHDRRLADAGAPFSAGDARLPGYNPPSRRLVLAAYLPDIWFIHYEHGGYGRHAHLLAFTRSGGRWRLAHSAVGFYEFSDLAGLRQAVKKRQFERSVLEY